MRVSLTKGAIETDKVKTLRFAFMEMYGAFEDFDAKDELTTNTIGDLLELTSESTDRQTYPIYDGTDLTAKYGTSQTLGTDSMGLTTDTKLENVAFNVENYYDALNYYTTSDKLKRQQSGLRWITLTENNPQRLIRFTMKSSVKAINPYAFLGHMIHVPKVGTKYQTHQAGDLSAIDHLIVDYRCRYLEWNDNFQHQRA